jgi:hypothetical protein
MIFLTEVYLKEKNPERCIRLRRTLERAVGFSARAQTRRGGWGYVSAAESGDFDEGSATAVQLHALIVARNAGIPVPRTTLDRAKEYCRQSTVIAVPRPDQAQVEAGMTYSLQSPSSHPRPPITIAALAAFHLANEGDSALALQWLNYTHAELTRAELRGRPYDLTYWQFTQFYLAQVLYRLDEDGHARLRPDLAKLERDDRPTLLRWSRYRASLFNLVASSQTPDGSWQSEGGIYLGPVYTTATYLIIFQMDTGHLAFCRR